MMLQNYIVKLLGREQASAMISAMVQITADHKRRGQNKFNAIVIIVIIIIVLFILFVAGK
jgi:hypothetical protein